MVKRRWRRFVPRARRRPDYSGDDVFLIARRNIDNINPRNIDDLAKAEASFSQKGQSASSWLTLLLLRSPAASIAQQSMDERPHQKDHKTRLYKLIDFNDSYVSTILAMDDEQRRELSEKLPAAMADICERVGSRRFSNEQLEAITHGLSREVATYEAARRHGLDVEMTTRTKDAFGIDMTIGDARTGKYINVDCKTRSSFHFRLKDLFHEARISQYDMELAEEDGYAEVIHRSDNASAKIILLRVSEDDFGMINNFRFENELKFATRLRSIVAAYGKKTWERELSRD